MEYLTELVRHLLVPNIPILEKILRPIIVYIFLIVALRLAGKRSMASLNPFDLVVLLSISNTVQNAIIGDDTSLSGGMIGATTLLVTNYLVLRFFFKHRRLEELVEGKPTRLIKNGKILEKNLEHELITHTELEIAAHRQGFHTLEDIESAELEPGGGIAFFAKTPTPQEVRDHEMHRKLDQITAELTELRARLTPQAGA